MSEMKIDTTALSNIDLSANEYINSRVMSSISQKLNSISNTEDELVEVADNVEYGDITETSSTSVSASNGTNTTSSTTSDANSIEALQEQLANEEAELANLQNLLTSINNDEESEVAYKKQVAENAKTNYQTLVRENARGNTEVQALLKKQEMNETSIANKEKEILAKEGEIEETEDEISSKENQADAIEKQIQAVQKSLSEWNNTEITEDNIDEVTNQRDSLTYRIDNLSSLFLVLQDEISNLYSVKTTKETELKNLNNEKTKLVNNGNEIEVAITNKVSEVISEALKEYAAARVDYETTKNSKIEETKAAITTKKEEITNTNSKINTLKASIVKNETSTNSVSNYNINSTSASGEYNAERGQALANAANKLHGGTSKAGGYCARGVADAIEDAFGYRLSGNGCDYGEILANRDDWTEITSTISSAADLKNLPAGAVVSWSTYEAGHTKSNGKYGHVFISDGNGHEISDFKGNISTSYANWGATFRVFVPS